MDRVSRSSLTRLLCLRWYVILRPDPQLKNSGMFQWAMFFIVYGCLFLPNSGTSHHYNKYRFTINIFGNFLERQKGKACEVSCWAGPIWCSYHLCVPWTFYDLQHLSISTVKPTDGFWWFCMLLPRIRSKPVHALFPSQPALPTPKRTITWIPYLTESGGPQC